MIKFFHLLKFSHKEQDVIKAKKEDGAVEIRELSFCCVRLRFFFLEGCSLNCGMEFRPVEYSIGLVLVKYFTFDSDKATSD